MKKTLPKLIKKTISHIKCLREKMIVLENYPEDDNEDDVKDCFNRSKNITEDLLKILHCIQTDKKKNLK